MPFTAGCWTRPPAALAAATHFLTACAGVSSDVPPGVCPPEVEYSGAEQAHIVEKVAALPEHPEIVGWLADYAVLRNQVPACRSTSPDW